MTPIGLERVGGTETRWGAAVRLARRAAKTPAPVLLLGETGTGKEILAQFIHRESGRPGTIVAVNCGAIPAEQVEFELFGHAKGAYTGVTAEGKGYIREADGGTLFLDEIGELPLAAQAKLLRVLQERKVRPMGGKGEIAVDFRLVCATHCDLDAMVREHRFREDLYNRIAVCDIHLPALRERPDEDVIELARYFVREDGPEYGHRHARLDAGAEQYLKTEWHAAAPGNTRGLRRLVWRALVRCEKGVVRREDLTDLAPAAVEVDGKPVRRARQAHGDEVRERVLALREADPGLSIREIARRVGVPVMTVCDWLASYRRRTGVVQPTPPDPE